LHHDYEYLGHGEYYTGVRPGVERVLNAAEALHAFCVTCNTPTSEVFEERGKEPDVLTSPERCRGRLFADDWFLNLELLAIGFLALQGSCIETFARRATRNKKVCC